MIVSIFNDVIGPVMRGPSSSHCAAALRIGRLARDLMDAASSPTCSSNSTARDRCQPRTRRKAPTWACSAACWAGTRPTSACRFRRRPCVTRASASASEIVDAGDPHPNTYRLTLRGPTEEHSLVAISTGGGMIEVIAVDGFPVSMFGDCFETLLWAEGRGQRIGPNLGDSLRSEDVLLHDPPARNLWKSRPRSS